MGLAVRGVGCFNSNISLNFFLFYVVLLVQFVFAFSLIWFADCGVVYGLVGLLLGLLICCLILWVGLVFCLLYVTFVDLLLL